LRRAAVFVACALAAGFPSPAGAQSATSSEVLRGLDTLYAGRFAQAAAYFARLGERDTLDPVGPTFHAATYIWWAAALEDNTFQQDSIYYLLDQAVRRARALGRQGEGEGEGDFWLATALGYRARQHDIHGNGWRAARDGKAMRDAYARVLAADSTCYDCYLGLGVYQYGLARASGLARLVAKILGFGSGEAETGIRLMHVTVERGTLARVEATWVLAAALEREAVRDPERRPIFRRSARRLVEPLAAEYPENIVFRRFLEETAQVEPQP
jgi:hypothetical protein